MVKRSVQKGGEAHMTRPTMPMVMAMPMEMKMKMKNRSSTKKRSQKGGSPASTLVMQATTESPLMNDYFPRTDSNSPSCNMKGGSTASDMVSSNLMDNAQTVAYPEGFKVSGDINSLNLYAPSGGARKGKMGRKSKKSSKSKKSKKSKNSRKGKKSKKSKSKSKSKKSRSHKHMMRGGSDWISSQYSLGNINNQMNNTADFSAAQGVSRDILMNPPNMGLAGSGSPMGELEGGNVQSVGAPLV